MDTTFRQRIEAKREELRQQYFELCGEYLCNVPEINEYAGHHYGSELAGIDYSKHDEKDLEIQERQSKVQADLDLLQKLLDGNVEFQEGKADELQLQISALTNQIEGLETEKKGLEEQATVQKRIAELLR